HRLLVHRLADLVHADRVVRTLPNIDAQKHRSLHRSLRSLDDPEPTVASAHPRYATMAGASLSRDGGPPDALGGNTSQVMVDRGLPPCRARRSGDPSLSAL